MLEKHRGGSAIVLAIPAGGVPVGAAIARDDPLDLAVVELGNPGVEERIRDLVRRGVPVLAFGSHVDAAALRAARNAGARAVPNSEVATALRELLDSHPPSP